MIKIDFDEVEELLKSVRDRTGDSVSFDIDIWHYKGSNEPSAPAFALWVTKYNTHFTGSTLDIVRDHLLAYEKGYKDGIKSIQSNPA